MPFLTWGRSQHQSNHLSRIRMFSIFFGTTMIQLNGLAQIRDCGSQHILLRGRLIRLFTTLLSPVDLSFLDTSNHSMNHFLRGSHVDVSSGHSKKKEVSIYVPLRSCQINLLFQNRNIPLQSMEFLRFPLYLRTAQRNLPIVYKYVRLLEAFPRF